MSAVQLTAGAQNIFLDMLVDYVFVPGAGLHTTCRLFTNNYMPSFLSTIADFVEASFGGYAAVNLDTWTDPYLRPDQQWEVGATTVGSFIASGVTAPQTVYGWYLLDGSGRLILAERFDNPIDITTDGQAVFVLPRVSIQDLSGSGVIED